MLTYSVKPRGGVVHALAVSEALARRGHEIELFAIGRPGETFFRRPAVPATVIAHTPPNATFDERIAALIDAYACGLRAPLESGGFDIVHAQDCISANAALALRDAGVIARVLRTVHHVDVFRSPSLVSCQERSIVAPDLVVCVSHPWVARVREEFGVEAAVVGNGVDLERYRPPHGMADRAADRSAVGFGERFVVLAVGGIEPRKGSLTLLDAFAQLRETLPRRDPLLILAGGATLFDYRDEIARFGERRAELGLGDREVQVRGPVADEELQRLYRAADVLAFPSVKEGFGLVVLEALASDLPVVASGLDVLREFLTDGRSALLVPSGAPAALAHALARVATDDELARGLRTGGRAVAASYGWDAAAQAHDRAYATFLASATELAH
jgi:glycosyltransferase-like protein